MTPLCELCGSGFDVARLLVEWIEPIFPGRTWEAIPRCRDGVGCRLRVEEAGKRWPVRDAGAPARRVATVTTGEADDMLHQRPDGSRVDVLGARFMDRHGRVGPSGSLVDLTPEEW